MGGLPWQPLVDYAQMTAVNRQCQVRHAAVGNASMTLTVAGGSLHCAAGRGNR